MPWLVAWSAPSSTGGPAGPAVEAAGGLVEGGTRQARQLARKAAPIIDSVSAEVREARNVLHHTVIPAASSAAERAVGSIEQAAQAAQPHVAQLAGHARHAADVARGAVGDVPPLSRLAGLAADGLELAVEAARPAAEGAAAVGSSGPPRPGPAPSRWWPDRASGSGSRVAGSVGAP